MSSSKNEPGDPVFKFNEDFKTSFEREISLVL